MWQDILTGISFAAMVFIMFLVGHVVGVLMLRRAQQEPELTPEQEAMLAQLVDQPR
jgi:GAF domain-containing protein